MTEDKAYLNFEISLLIQLQWAHISQKLGSQQGNPLLKNQGRYCDGYRYMLKIHFNTGKNKPI